MWCLLSCSFGRFRANLPTKCWWRCWSHWKYRNTVFEDCFSVVFPTRRNVLEYLTKLGITKFDDLKHRREDFILYVHKIVVKALCDVPFHDMFLHILDNFVAKMEIINLFTVSIVRISKKLPNDIVRLANFPHIGASQAIFILTHEGNWFVKSLLWTTWSQLSVHCQHVLLNLLTFSCGLFFFT